MAKKKFEAGKNTSIRIPKDFPDYALKFLNETNIPLSDVILVGIRTIMNEQGQGIFFPANNLTEDKISKLEGNPDLQRAIMKWVDELVFSDRPLGMIRDSEEAATKESSPALDDDLKAYAKDLFGLGE
jgi:hypothetical protein